MGVAQERILPKKKSSSSNRRESYRAPALERGLDILELLSSKTHAVTQSVIARELGRSSGEVFRMLSCLVERGYVARSGPTDGYLLTMHLHQLVQNWPLLKNVVEVSLPEMHRLAEHAGQSCHLGVYNAGRMHVAAQVESPQPVGLTVRVGMDYSLLKTASGRILLAWQPAMVAAHWISASDEIASKKRKVAITERLETIRNRGYELSESDILQGVTDISFPILDSHRGALAALTMPYLSPLKSRKKIQSVISLVRQSAAAISRLMMSDE